MLPAFLTTQRFSSLTTLKILPAEADFSLEFDFSLFDFSFR